MPSLKVAHIREQGVDLVIVPLDPGFGRQSQAAQDDTIGGVQNRVRASGLAGTVVPVWDDGGGRMAFRAPRPWHPFFSGLSLHSVWSNVNREVSW